jgi:iron(III) transport system ATP-binding protein
MAFLNVKGISRKTGTGFYLRDISFSQKRGQRIALIGETGSGKSTLLRIVAGLTQPDRGKVTFRNAVVTGPANALVPGHPGIGYVSQSFVLPKFLYVRQVLAYANTLGSDEARRIYKVCRIDHLMERRTDSLSGGEQQRIAIARCLIASPQLVLLDEPFTNVDRIHKGVMKALIEDLGNKLDISCILISHEPDDILSWADSILIMQQGRLIQKGMPTEIYNSPRNAYTAGLLGSYTTLAAGSRLLRARAGGRRRKKDVYVRPEQVKFVKGGRNSLTGRILSVNYYGTHWEAMVETSEGTVTVWCHRARRPGTSVRIALTRQPD